MKRTGYVVAAIAALSLGLAPVLSQEGTGGQKPSTPEIKDWEQKWEQLHRPGNEHKKLGERAGNWEITGKAFKMGAENKMMPREVTGNAKIELVFDRFLQEELTTTCEGKTSNALGYIGYDNSSKQYQSVYIGDWGTGMQLFRSQPHPIASGDVPRDPDRRDARREAAAGQSLTLSGSWTEAAFDNLSISERVVMTNKSNDEYVVEFFGKYGDKEEVKIMELTYRRK